MRGSHGAKQLPARQQAFQRNERERNMKRFLLAGVAGVFVAAAFSPSFAAYKKTLAFVVNGASDFWKAAEAGVKKAQGVLPNYNLQLKYPEQAAAAVQQRMM